MRIYLQNPSVLKYDYRSLSHQFTISEIETIFSIYHSSPNLETEYLTRFALEFHLGLYCIHAGQLTRYDLKFPHSDYPEWRDYYVHGVGHSFHIHTTDNGLDKIHRDVGYLKQIISPYLTK